MTRAPRARGPYSRTGPRTVCQNSSIASAASVQDVHPPPTTAPRSLARGRPAWRERLADRRGPPCPEGRRAEFRVCATAVLVAQAASLCYSSDKSAAYTLPLPAAGTNHPFVQPQAVAQGVRVGRL